MPDPRRQQNRPKVKVAARSIASVNLPVRVLLLIVLLLVAQKAVSGL